MRNSQWKSHGGFTLIELLVVIGLIAFLTAIVVVVAGRMGEGAKINKTKATLVKINLLLKQRREAFDRLDVSQETQYIQQTVYPGVSRQVAEIIAKKELYRSLFPQSDEDLKGPDQVRGTHATTGLNDDSPIATIVDTMENATPKQFNRDNHRFNTESSELFYLALTQSTALGSEVETDLFSAAEVQDTDEDGLLEFVDGWDRPLHFYRWPTRLVRPATEGTEGVSQAVSNLGLTTARYQHPVHVSFANYYANYTVEDVGISAALLLGPLPPLPPSEDLDSDGVFDPGEDANGNGLLDLTQRGAGTRIAQEVFDPLAKDADDPLGGLSGFARWMMSSPPPNNALAPAANNPVTEARYHAPQTYHQPLIVSAGADGILGLYQRSLTTTLDQSYFDNFGHLAQPEWTKIRNIMDNITNLNLQIGGN